jgi:hypothetical protein
MLTRDGPNVSYRPLWKPFERSAVSQAVLAAEVRALKVRRLPIFTIVTSKTDLALSSDDAAYGYLAEAPLDRTRRLLGELGELHGGARIR